MDIKTRHQKWDAMDRANSQLLREMTIEESVKAYLSLLHSMAPFIRETQDLFLPERRAYLVEFQDRLRKFGEWRKQQNGDCAEPA